MIPDVLAANADDRKGPLRTCRAWLWAGHEEGPGRRMGRLSGPGARWYAASGPSPKKDDRLYDDGDT